MTNERAFLKRILSDLNDDTTRLVYADWLEERGDDASNAKSEFLRVLYQWSKLTEKKREKHPSNARLRKLAESLDKDWLAVTSEMPIENCELTFEFECPKRWENLNATEDIGVRLFEECKNNVYYCNSIDEAKSHALAGDCVAVSLSVIRRPLDVEDPLRMLLGRIMPGELDRRIEEEREEAERAYRRPSRRGRK